MGRYSTVYGYTVEDCKTLSIEWFIGNRYAIKNYRTSGTVTFSTNGRPTGSIGYDAHLEIEPSYFCFHYTFRETEPIDYRVYLAKTYPCFGGVRFWFVCPAIGCGKKAGKLYSPPNSRYFLCRTCQNPTYTSCRESHKFDSLFASIAARTGQPVSLIRQHLKKRDNHI